MLKILAPGGDATSGAQLENCVALARARAAAISTWPEPPLLDRDEDRTAIPVRRRSDGGIELDEYIL